MEKIKNVVIIGIIIVIGFLAFSYKLADVPPGIYVDEATTGFNAYSILKTGKDEYGKVFPIAFRFFGSYSPPLYVYLTTIPVALFGLNEYSIRIISVICACLLILILFAFLKANYLIDKKVIPFLLLLFIITPWNFFFARTGYELYLGFLIFSLGILFCWFGLKKKFFLTFGIPILSLSTFASHPQIFSAPVFVAGFICFFYKLLGKKNLILGLIIALIIQIPHLFLLNTKAFFNKGDLFYFNEILLNSEKSSLSQFLSVPLSFTYSFLARITTYFSPKSLFFFPDPDLQRSMPEVSVFYNWMVIPFLIGIFLTFKNFKTGFIKFLVILIFATVIPAALTRDPFSTQRALGLLLPFFLIISIGISEIFKLLKFKKFLFIFVLFFGISLIMIWRSYFILLPAERAIAWNYGFKQLSQFISQNPDSKFLIDQSRGKPSYIELAFFLKTNPKLLQDNNLKIREDYYNLNQFNPEYKFENIEIKTIDWSKDIYTKQILVGDELAISESQAKEHFLTKVFQISDPRGYPIFLGFSTNPLKKCQQTNFSSDFCKDVNSNTIN